jgi:DNA-binding MarR family transcriptional regulator/GNAT superfamily N-acetyltransferase
MDTIAEVRSFNRFYTRQMGLLNEHLPASKLSLAEARVLYELATGGAQTAADLCRRLEMDKAHVSRILARFRKRGYIQGREKPDNAKQILIGLKPAGRRTFEKAQAGTRTQIRRMLGKANASKRRRLVGAFHEIHDVLAGGVRPELAATRPRARIRRVRMGDLGYVSWRQAVVYHEEFGWDWTYEKLAIEVLAKFAREFDPRRYDGWIAEVNGRIAGSVFLMPGDEEGTAKLRLLYVEPSGRGMGIGRRLVQRCIARARELGYRLMTLWTNSVLVSARRIYEAEGFRLTKEERHTSFGKKLVGQTWELALS